MYEIGLIPPSNPSQHLVESYHPSRGSGRQKEAREAKEDLDLGRADGVGTADGG